MPSEKKHEKAEGLNKRSKGERMKKREKIGERKREKGERTKKRHRQRKQDPTLKKKKSRKTKKGLCQHFICQQQNEITTQLMCQQKKSRQT